MLNTFGSWDKPKNFGLVFLGAVGRNFTSGRGSSRFVVHLHFDVFPSCLPTAPFYKEWKCSQSSNLFLFNFPYLFQFQFFSPDPTPFLCSTNLCSPLFHGGGSCLLLFPTTAFSGFHQYWQFHPFDIDPDFR